MEYVNPKFSDYSRAIIDRYNLKKTSQNEFHGACPRCGEGEDRFWIYPKDNGDLGVQCRKCDDFKGIFKALEDDGVIPKPHSGLPEPIISMSEIAREHTYEDEDGNPVRKAIKYKDGSWKQKSYRDGVWCWGGKDAPNVPYGLKRLLEGNPDEPVFVLEGEKDCERAWNAGLQATTNVSGAGNWKAVLNQYLKGGRIYIFPDNDVAGANHARKVHDCLKQDGIDSSILWEARKSLPPKGDFSDWMDANDNDAVKFLEFCNMVHTEPAPEVELASINWMRVSDLKDRPVKERLWTVDGWIPRGQVTLLYADGGVGKSQIILQLLMNVSLGEPWFGLRTYKGSALYLGAEDDTDELHRRFHDVINARFNCYADFTDVVFSSLAGEDALLASYDPRAKKLSPSKIMTELTASIAQQRPSICVIDTLADVFPADENDRALARQFIGMLRKPAIEHNCAVVVLAHPSLSGISTGRGTSGSTGWNNSVRSRITMERDDQNPDRRTLKLAKSNYSKIGTEISITWENGVFVHDPQSSGLDAKAANSKARRVFLSLLESYSDDGKVVNANGGSTYAPTAFAADENSEGVTKPAFRTAMKSLLAEGVIKSENTKRGTCLVVLKR